MIFFCHVPRTAGTTIHSYFSKPFGGPERVGSGNFQPGSRWLVVSSPAEVPLAAQVAKNLPDRHFYLGGHAGLHDLAAAGIDAAPTDVVVAMTRNPVDRAVSLYYLVQRSPEWFPFLDASVSGRGFQYFYEYCRDTSLFFHNDHCRQISGSEDFATTLACVRDKFNLVGSVEAMSAFESALVEVCAPVIPGFTILPARENTAFHECTSSGAWTPKRSLQDLASDALIRRIEDDNREDALLVDFIEREQGGLFVNHARHPAPA
jgi:hypothetical protein